MSRYVFGLEYWKFLVAHLDEPEDEEEVDDDVVGEHFKDTRSPGDRRGSQLSTPSRRNLPRASLVISHLEELMMSPGPRSGAQMSPGAPLSGSMSLSMAAERAMRDGSFLKHVEDVQSKVGTLAAIVAGLCSKHVPSAGVLPILLRMTEMQVNPNPHHVGTLGGVSARFYAATKCKRLRQAIKAAGDRGRDQQFQGAARHRSHRLSVLQKTPTARLLTLPNYNKWLYQNLLPGTPIAIVHGVWLQADPCPLRLVRRSNLASLHREADEILTSVDSGALSLTTVGVTWMIKAEAADTSHGLDTTLRIPFENIERFSSGEMPARRDVDLNQVREESATGSRDYALYYLSIYYNGQVMKFFPFHESEVHELLLALSDFTHKEPVDEAKFVEGVLEKEQQRLRDAILQHLLAANKDAKGTGGSWIKHSKALLPLMNDLLINASMKTVDIERLFHSCRLNKDVAAFTLKRLMAEYDKSRLNDDARARVLVVLQRLMDRSVVTGADPIFTELSEWMELSESQLDPYKNVRIVNLIQKLRAMANDIRRQPLGVINPAQLKDTFEGLDQLKLYRESILGERW